MAATNPSCPSRADRTGSPDWPGRDEPGRVPDCLARGSVPAGQKTLYFEDKHGRLTVTGSDAYGLPTATDTDVIVALIYLTKMRNNFTDVKVNFSKYELIKLLNWPDEGESYKRLDQSFNRWGGVWLVYDKCWWNNKTETIRQCEDAHHGQRDFRGTRRENPRRAIALAPVHLHMEQNLHRKLPGRQSAAA